MPFADVIALFVPPLNAQGVSYAVVGGVATIIYSAPRLTNDIDLVVALPGASIHELLAAFTSDDFFVPPLETVQEEVRRLGGGHFNIIHLPSAQKADFYPAGNDPLDAMALERYQRHLVGGHMLRVAPPEVIVIRKLEWYRDGGAERHLRDVRGILEYGGAALDRQILEALVAQRGLRPELAAAMRLPLD